MQVVYGRRFKAKLRIEGPSGFVFGMGEKRANANNVGCLGGPKNRVFGQPAALAVALLAPVDGQSGKQDDWDRVLPQTLGHAW